MPHGQVTTDTIFAWKCSATTMTVPSTCRCYICLPLPPASRLPPVCRHSAPDFLMPALLAGPATLVFRVFKATHSVANRHQVALLLQRACTIHGIAVQSLGYWLDSPGFNCRCRQNVQTCSGDHTVCCSISTGSSCPEAKVVGAWSWPTSV